MKVLNQNDSKITKFLVSYYKFKPMRIFIYFATFICEVTLIIYIMILPIQLAYHSLISSHQNKLIQDNIDFVICAFFTFHIFLYFDSLLQKIIKSPNSLPAFKVEKLGKWTRLISIQLGYDLICWGLSVFMSSPQQNTFQERILELIFFFKVYKIYKFHKKVIYSIIGQSIYPIYRIFFTVMVTFSVISYLSSIFYAIDYAIYQNGGPLADYIWLMNMGTEPNLINKPFWVQLLMINYWAMGTSSTAAYGDICGVAPEEVIWNIFVLYFANFLYGYYLNSIQIIPKQIKQRKRKILQQFNHFQKYNEIGQQKNKNVINDQLYLKILCSIQYNQTEKSTRKVINQSVPQKYIQQIKTQIYSQFFTQEQTKLYSSKGFFSKQQILLNVSKIINESVFEKSENVYQYDHIDQTDLFFIHQGSVDLKLPGELSYAISIRKQKGQMFGQYNFITNQKIKTQAFALEYVSAYIIKRRDYRKCLCMNDFFSFENMFGRCLQFTEQEIKDQLYKKYNDKLQQKQSILNINKPSSKITKIKNLFEQRKSLRLNFNRQQLNSKRIFISPKNNKKKSIGIQTNITEYIIQKQFDKIAHPF